MTKGCRVLNVNIFLKNLLELFSAVLVLFEEEMSTQKC